MLYTIYTIHTCPWSKSQPVSVMLAAVCIYGLDAVTDIT